MARRLMSSLFVYALFSAMACSKRGPDAEATPIWEQAQADTTLESGRKIWRLNCKRCHAFGVEGAPRIGDVAAWKPRAERGLDALAESALKGVVGKAGGEMPPRGGNEKLSDAEVRSAVTFMLAALEKDQAMEAKR
jgi:cytochrome c5